jgi:phosphohistidine phosphatase
MDLILWRHADAESGDNLDDRERRLTGKGRKRAASMAAWLDRQLPESARIITSPARRAMETAEALASRSGRKLMVDERLSVGADPVVLLHVAGWPASKHPVVLVGHQPTLGQLTSFLLFGEEHPFAIRKCSIVWLTNRAREEANEARDAYPVNLRALMCPDLL